MQKSDQQKPDQSLSDKAGPEDARTRDNPIGIDDIGLPSGIQPDEVPKLNEVKADPRKSGKG
jgi:hypothetical protein